MPRINGSVVVLNPARFGRALSRALEAAELSVNKAAAITRILDDRQAGRRGISQPALRAIARGERDRLTYETHVALERLSERMYQGRVGRLYERGVRSAKARLAAARTSLRDEQRRLVALKYPAASHRAAVLRLERCVEEAALELQQADTLSRGDHGDLLKVVGAVGAFQEELRVGVSMPSRRGVVLAIARRGAAKKK